MAKRRKNQSQKFPLPVLALGLILIVAAGLIFLFQGNPGGGAPDVSVEPQTIDYGNVPLDTEKTFEFTVTNEGEGVLRFKEEPYIEVVEGC